MTNKLLNLSHFQQLAKRYGHRLVSASNENYIIGGTLTLACDTCQKTFDITAKHYQYKYEKSYLPTALVPAGCRFCSRKRESPASLANRRVSRSSASQRKNAARLEKYKHITNVAELISHLKGETNPHNLWILEKLKHPTALLSKSPCQELSVPSKDKKTLTLSQEPDLCDKLGWVQKHHILPIHDGGPDVAWNLVALTYEEHCLAHDLRFQAYGQLKDQVAFQLMTAKSGHTSMRRKLIHQVAMDTSKRKGVGFFHQRCSTGGVRWYICDREQQKRNSLKACAAHTQRSLQKIQPQFERGMVWRHKTSGCTVTVKPGSHPDVIALLSEFIKQLSTVQDVKSCLDLAKLKSQPEIYTTSYIRKVIKQMYPSCYGWRIIETSEVLSM